MQNTLGAWIIYYVALFFPLNWFFIYGILAFSWKCDAGPVLLIFMLSFFILKYVEIMHIYEYADKVAQVVRSVKKSFRQWQMHCIADWFNNVRIGRENMVWQLLFLLELFHILFVKYF